MKYKVTFLRHGVQDELTFDTRSGAETFENWISHSSAGINAEIVEVDEPSDGTAVQEEA